jgi:hypothetical protein
MKMKNIFPVFCLIFVGTVAAIDQEDLTCFQPGECRLVKTKSKQVKSKSYIVTIENKQDKHC